MSASHPPKTSVNGRNRLPQTRTPSVAPAQGHPPQAGTGTSAAGDGCQDHDHPAYLVLQARAPQSLPLVIDLPHSHGLWPNGVATTATPGVLSAISDAYVDQFWITACNGRAPVLVAQFHRSLIDANRALTDIDPDLLSGPWPGPLHPSDHSRRGTGLIRRWVRPDVPLYQRRLRVSEVQTRITDCYEPYHDALSRLINEVQGQFGFCVHLNAQAMKPVGNAMNHDPDLPRPDFVVSNLNGMSCVPALTSWVVDLLRRQGYEVWINHLYMGAELIRRHAQPLLGRHGLQIEVNQALYMAPSLDHPGPYFNRLGPALQALIDGLTADQQRLADLCLPHAPALSTGVPR